MEGELRREQIIDVLKKSTTPVSGTELSELLHVSRQVIVQDIALLRAVNKSILSTNKGYVLYKNGSDKCNRTFHVNHDAEHMEEELNIIVDNSGKVLDVVVEHDIYGQITVDLIISSRRDVREFMDKTRINATKPLNSLTNGYHYHTVEADSEEDLNIIEEELKKAGFLIS